MSAVPALTPALLRCMPLPRHDDNADKEDRGRALVIAGSAEVPGAALLAGTGVLRAGAGKLQLGVPALIALPLALALPEARAFGLPETPDGDIAPEAAEQLRRRIERCDAVVVGPGMIDVAAASELTARLLALPPGPAFLLDAAAVAKCPSQCDLLHRHGGRIVVTPHAGEMATMLGVEKAAILDDPLGTARRTAETLRAVVVLKGGCTRIVAPSGEAWAYDGGHVGLATSGSGDTLAGIVAGLLARGAEPAQAALWGVYLHGEAGNRLAQTRGRIGFLARELLAEIPAIMAALDGD